jgi:flagellar biogenesis protein FliO
MPGTEAFAVPAAEVPSLVGPALRLGAALAVFLVAAFVFVKWRKRFVSEKRALEVLERVGLSRGASLVLVRAGGERILVGVSPDGVRLLKSLPPSPPDPVAASFAQTLAAAEAVAPVEEAAR